MMPSKTVATALIAGALAAMASWSDAAFAADPIGTWYTAENRSQVRIAHCGGGLCGGIV
jgi:uncharacterized protein (DUF2147 family)